VINLSSQKLSNAQYKVLLYSLKFAPTPKENNEELRIDIKEFIRKLRLAEIFQGDDENETDQRDKPLFANKSKYNPQRGRDNVLDNYTDYLQNCPVDNSNHVPSNISKEEETAIKDLINNDGIIIKQADKGGAVVIMDTEFYKSKIELMLNDPNQYETADIDSDDRTMSKVKDFIGQFGN